MRPPPAATRMASCGVWEMSLSIRSSPPGGAARPSPIASTLRASKVKSSASDRLSICASVIVSRRSCGRSGAVRGENIEVGRRQMRRQGVDGG